MAFGNKKKADDPAAVAEVAVDDDEPLFPIEAAAEAEPEDAAEAAVAEAAPEPELELPADGGTDALLNMFQASDSAESDRSALLDLAGDAELADILDDLQTLKSAMGLGRV